MATNHITHVHKVKTVTLKRTHTTIQIITIPGTTYHRHHRMLNMHHPHRIQGRQSILQDLHSHCQSTTKLLTATTTTAARVSPNILPLYLLCVSSTTISLHSTLLQPSYYTLQYYNHLTTLYITTLYIPQDGPHRINRGRSPTATPGLHQSTYTLGRLQLHHFLSWSRHSRFPRYAL